MCIRGLVALVALAASANSPLLAQADWTQKFPPHFPSKRYGPAMAQCCPGGSGVILFGGYPSPFNPYLPLDDTWIWNGSDWGQLFTGLAGLSATVPPVRSNASIAFVPGTGVPGTDEVVMFGGAGYTAPLGDTWIFKNYKWSQVNLTFPSAPQPRSGASMAYDAARKRVLLTGGEFGVNFTFADTWEFDPATNTWRNLNSNVLPPRANMAMARCNFFNPDGRGLRPGVLLQGGNYLEHILADTWIFDPLFVKWFGPYLPAPNPGNRFAHAMAYYPSSGQAVLFGGRELITLDTGGTFQFEPVDTWNGACGGRPVWSVASPAHQPPGRMWPGMATGPYGTTIVLFGGGGVSDFLNDTWTWGRRVACAPIDGSDIPAGSDVNCLFDPRADEQFGGWTTESFAQRRSLDLSPAFHTLGPGPASITAAWTDSSGAHTQTFQYTIAQRSH